MNRGFISSLKNLMSLLRPRRVRQLTALIVLSLVGAVAELCTIGAIFPLLALAIDPAALDRLPLVGDLIDSISQLLGCERIVAAASLLAFAAILATAFRLTLNWISQRIVFGIQTELVIDIFDSTLARPYVWFSTSHSAILLSNIEKGLQLGAGVIQPLVQSVSAAVMGIGIGFFLFALSPLAAGAALLMIAAAYLGIGRVSRRAYARISTTMARLRPTRSRIVQEAYGGIREIILDQTRPALVERLHASEAELNRSVALSVTIAQMPRILIEGALIVLVAILAIIFSLRPGGIGAALPVLGAMAIGAQRMLPMIQQMFVGWSALQSARASIVDVVTAMSPPPPPPPPPAASKLPPPLPFTNEIVLRDLQFRYDERSAALNGVTLTIRKGQRIGIIGRTGSGKSTLADLLLGLLQPTDGRIEVDGRPLFASDMPGWWRQIAHVPQAIFLADDSIAANIAFGHTPIDVARAIEAAKRAGLGEFVEGLPDGIQTVVGERGARLSGGQRQRIGIARALYKEAQLLILDEATSALDNETEQAVMDSVDGLGEDLTIVLIAHRLTTLRRCDRIIELDKGRIVADGTYAEIVERRQPKIG